VNALGAAINGSDLEAFDKVFTDDVVMEWPQSAAYSAPSRTPIPRQVEQSFHGKPNTDSTASRTPVPRQAEQFVSPAWNR
jgi:hypothetical protein